MLGCYPIQATEENWVHDSLVSMINEVHRRIDAGEDIATTQQSWENMAPATLDAINHGFLVRSSGIRDYFFTYVNLISHLNIQDRHKILTTLESQNRIPELLNGIQGIETIKEDFPDVNTAAYDLFVFSFKKLADFEVRSRQYQIIFNSLDIKICTFCGIERVMDPTETAQDQDHYLPKSIYPFAAVNMRNLVPMCRCCNRDYKSAIDVLRDVNGLRRMAFDPYNCSPPTISLLRSIIDAETSPPLPEWLIDFAPQSEQAETWDAVFSIRTRFKRDILNQYYDTWLKSFRTRCAKERKRGRIQANFSLEQIREVLAHYVEDKSDSPYIGMGGFLEPLVFEFLLNQFDEGDERVVDLIRDSVLGSEMEEAA